MLLLAALAHHHGDDDAARQLLLEAGGGRQPGTIAYGRHLARELGIFDEYMSRPVDPNDPRGPPRQGLSCSVDPIPDSRRS